MNQPLTRGNNMKVSNMTSNTGNKVANQFIITNHGRGVLGNFTKRETFQSYDSVIAVRTIWPDEIRIELDKTYWNYSVTTSKYRNQFLGEDTATTKTKIKNGEYKLVDLNN
jgi:hypothetical protein